MSRIWYNKVLNTRIYGGRYVTTVIFTIRHAGKDLGGTRLRDEFVMKSRATMLVNTGLFLPIHMVFLLLRMDLMLEWA